MPAGAWQVDLVPITDRHLVADTVAGALGLPPAAGGDPLHALASQLGRRRLLVVLDNCEHLLTECARVAVTLLQTCPGVSVLATSREPLHVDGEVVLRVPSLALPARGVECLRNVQAVLEVAGSTMANVVWAVWSLRNPDDFDAFNEEWARWFAVNPPARHGAILPLPDRLSSVRISIGVIAIAE